MTTTRRAALMGALAVPVAAAFPAVAAEPDPIFALIEAQKQTARAFDAAIDAQQEAEAKFSNRFGTTRPNVVLLTRAEWEADPTRQKWPFGDDDAMRLYSGKQIDRYTTERSEKRRNLRQRLRAELAEANRVYRRDVTPLERTHDAAMAADSEARLDIAYAEPTTLAGVIAVLNHVSDADGAGFFADAPDTTVFFMSIEAALRRIAGMEAVAA